MKKQLDPQILYGARTFRALLDAFARPGKIQQLAYPHFWEDVSVPLDDSSSINIYALAALFTLLDRETSFAIAAHGQWLPPAASAVKWVELRSGSHYAAAEQAAFALICDESSIPLVEHLSVGTLLEPESSATAICCVQRIAPIVPDAQAHTEIGITHEHAPVLTLRGPGIESTHSCQVSALSEAHRTTLLTTRRSYPLGIDIYLVDRSGLCIGLPRTTQIA